MELSWREFRNFIVGIFVLTIGIFLIGKANAWIDENDVVETSLLYKKGIPNEMVAANNGTKEEILEPEDNDISTESNEEVDVVSTEETQNNATSAIVYDGLTMEELSDKLNRSMNSTIAGYGELYASYSLELGLDPYLALAITLHETGCKWECSTLVKACNNVGGMKGQPSCGNGSYKAFDSLEDGIKGYLNNLYNNYYAYGLTTPETIGPKYAGSSEWASKINYYISTIKAN